jgi:hypothetical protein
LEFGQSIFKIEENKKISKKSFICWLNDLIFTELSLKNIDYEICYINNLFIDSKELNKLS